MRFVLPVLQRRAVIKLRARFGGAYEPGFDHFEQARCRACFGAFKLVDHVRKTGEVLLERMRLKGPFAALHLRFEPDMVSLHRRMNVRWKHLSSLRSRPLSQLENEKEREKGRLSLADRQRMGLPNGSLSNHPLTNQGRRITSLIQSPGIVQF